MGGYFPNIKEYYRPKSVDEIIQILDVKGDIVNPLAGGTSLSMRASSKIEGLVDLQSAGLKFIEKEDNGVSIGAMVTMRQMEKELRDLWGGVLKKAASTVGTRLVRNAVTLGGDLAAGLPWCDMPVLIAVMPARVYIAEKSGVRAVDSIEWAKNRPGDIIGNGIITKVYVAYPKKGEGAGFYKVMRVQGEYAAGVAAAYVRLNSGVIEDARVVGGATAPHPAILDYVEDPIKGRRPDDIDWDAIIAMVEDRFKPASDPRFDRDYRAHAVAVAIKRAVLEAIDIAGEKR